MQNGGPGLRAVGYVRVSSEEQAAEGYSLDAQERSIRHYCEARGWVLIRVHRDEGISAYRDVRRPQYEAMIAAMAGWDVVVVWKLNRLHRTMKGFVQVASQLKEAKKDLVSVTESIDTTTAAGEFVYHIFGALSQFESAQTAERVRMAFKEKFETDDRAWFSRAPLGYDLLNGQLELNEQEARTVRKAFALARRGVPVHPGIVQELDRLGMRGKGNGAAHGPGRLAQPTVLHVLHNVVYAGYVYHDGILRRAAHTPIVTDEEFNAVQVALYTRGRRQKRWPMIVGPDRLEATRICTSGPKKRKTSAAVYVPRERPAGLDELVMQETLRRAGA